MSIVDRACKRNGNLSHVLSFEQEANRPGSRGSQIEITASNMRGSLGGDVA